jgi:hypothetical protein
MIRSFLIWCSSVGQERWAGAENAFTANAIINREKINNDLRMNDSPLNSSSFADGS